ncbi:hypothetical protein POM88_030687 [Heracleum sosnowskyi]|uniref:F-box associated beta-propeller type 3 domain-containing protein n=1 Tax=Heracleum sosnowskyi TaxID=360622 RepID=A0AAD8MJ17_9APIA|nr:hypothetical protein POM88_030687 [Heracleum sosnowskyi]
MKKLRSVEMFSDDLLIEILVKLPVKSLLRCKSVYKLGCMSQWHGHAKVPYSKPWLFLISNPKFIKSHIKCAAATPGADQTLLLHDIDSDSISLFNLDSSKLEAPLQFPFSKGEFSFETHYEIVGSYNGVVCVSEEYYPTIPGYKKFKYDLNVYLWNPTTRQSKLIPQCNLGPKEELSVDIGFGFDPLCTDYKVIWAESGSSNKHVHVKVYSLNTNAWRDVEPPETKLADYFEYRCLCEWFVVSHWVVIDGFGFEQISVYLRY